MQTKLFLLISFLLALPMASFAEKQETTWSLQDCIEYAMQNNIEVRIQKLNEQDAQYDLEQSYANYLPSLNASFQHGYSFGRSVDPFTNEFSTERIMRQNTGASSSVVLFAGFQNVNYMRYNLLRNTAMRYDTEGLQNDIILTIAAAYMQILYNEDFVETATQQTEVIRQQLQRTRALFEGGTLPMGSVLEIEARLAEEELNLITARNNLRLSYLELIQLLDLDPEEEFAIEKPDAATMDQFNLSDPGAIFEKAVQVQPSIKSANMKVQMAEKLIDLERGRMTPSLTLDASMGTGYSEAALDFSGNEKPYNDQIRDNFNQYLGLSLRVPIFNHWNVRTRVQQSKVDLDRAQNQLELSRNNLNKAIHQAHADAIAAYQKYQATVKSLDAFSESFDYTRQRFDLGMVSSVEFNESQARLARAEREALQARYDYMFKMKILEFYMGEGFTI
ncbi:MAG: TolC family protein [Bacteroidota bacterium]